MTEKKEVVEFKPGVSVDVGPSFLVVSRQTTDGAFVNKVHRNCLFPMEITDESADLLERSSYFFIKSDNFYYIIGEDAISVVSAIGSGKVIRPMQDGLINANLQNANDLLFYIIKALVGDPIIPNEPLRYTVPSNSIDKDNDNLFHQKVLEGFFTKLGYNAKPIPEAMAVVYDCNPKMKLDGAEIPFTGIAISTGAGMWNISMAFKGLSLVEFSCTKSGDFLDQQVEKATGVSLNKIVRIKEKILNLDKIDVSDRVQVALGVYYDEMINRMVHHISNKFKDKSSEIEGEIEIVVAGGSSMPLGFCNRLEAVIKESNIPFKIYRVRHSNTPFYSVANGACIRARGDYEKSLKK